MPSTLTITPQTVLLTSGQATTFKASDMLNGTDFPIQPSAEAFSPVAFPHMSWNAYARNCRTRNPLDRDVLIKRAVGLPDTILDRAAGVLRTV